MSLRLAYPVRAAVWLTLLLPLSQPLRAAVATTITLGASPNRSTLSQRVTLTAAIAPISATGQVTFYDGAGILAIATLTAGRANVRVAGIII